MRSLLVGLLLILQAQPALGLALCLGLSRADARRMDSTCPMAGAEATVGADAAANECALAQVCAPSTAGLLSTKLAIAAVHTPRHASHWPPESAVGTERAAPPLPPPNA